MEKILLAVYVVVLLIAISKPRGWYKIVLGIQLVVSVTYLAFSALAQMGDTGHWTSDPWLMVFSYVGIVGSVLGFFLLKREKDASERATLEVNNLWEGKDQVPTPEIRCWAFYFFI